MSLANIKFISASNIEVTGKYTELSDTTAHRISEYQFIGVDGSYYQSTTLQGLRLPIKVYITGKDAVDTLRQWRAALNDKGVGTLYHPDSTVGIVPVIVSTYTVSRNFQRENLIVIDIEFLQSIRDLTKSASTLDEAVITNDSDTIIEKNITELEKTPIEYVREGIEKFKDGVENINSKISAVSTLVDTINQNYLDTLAEINSVNTSTLKELKKLARTTSFFFGLFKLTAESFNSQISEYANLQNILYKDFNATDYDLKRKKTNALSTTALIENLHCVFLKNVSSLEFKNRDALFFCIEQLRSITYDIIARTTAIAKSFEGTQVVYPARENAMNAYLIRCISYLILKHEDIQGTQKITLQRNYSLIEFCAIYFRSVSPEVINKFILYNNIPSSEFYMLRKGRVVSV